MPIDDITEEAFPSDEEFDDEEDDEESDSSDVDEKLAEDDVFDVEFLKCYSALKKKDDKIYDKNVRFFTEQNSSSEAEDGNDKTIDKDTSVGKASGSKKTNAPRMTLLDLQLRPGTEEIDELDKPKIDLNQQVSKSYYEKELEEIKKSIEKVGEDIDSESDDDLLVVKNSDGKEGAKKRRSKIESILDKIENEEDEDIEHLKEVWTNPDNLTDEDRYLRDYILNKRYLQASVNDGDDDGKGGFFSKNLEDLSDAETENGATDRSRGPSSMHRSEEKDFDKIARIPRNSTKTIRDMVEKQEKKEKRLKKLEKEKKRKKSLKDADCEDVVGDMPTRFHYRETEPNDYGLTAEELLMATDEELDQWVSLHECVAYKSKEEEIAQKKRFESKRDDMELKRKIFKSVYGQEADGQQPSEPSKSKKTRKRKRKRNTDSESSLVEVASEPVKQEKSSGGELSNRQKHKKQRRRGLNHKKFASVGVAPDRLLAYGLSKTKLKKGKLL